MKVLAFFHHQVLSYFILQWVWYTRRWRKNARASTIFLFFNMGLWKPLHCSSPCSLFLFLNNVTPWVLLFLHQVFFSFRKSKATTTTSLEALPLAQQEPRLWRPKGPLGRSPTRSMDPPLRPPRRPGGGSAAAGASGQTSPSQRTGPSGRAAGFSGAGENGGKRRLGIF